MKAVIPAAGLGKRFWPATQIVPKELLPVVTQPALHLVLEEALAAQIEEIILILSPEKKSLMAHVETFFPNIHFKFIEQEKPLGLGHAVGLAQEEIGAEPFFVLLPDTLMEATTPITTQLLRIFESTSQSVNAAQRIQTREIEAYGVYSIASSEGRLHLAKGVVEKPPWEKAPSDLAVTGRYLFTPEIFSALQETPPDRNGEIQLAEAMNILAQKNALYAYEFEGKHFDIGTPAGWIRANIHFGLKASLDIFRACRSLTSVCQSVFSALASAGPPYFSGQPKKLA